MKFWYRERVAITDRTGKPHYFTAHGRRWVVDGRTCHPVGIAGDVPPRCETAFEKALRVEIEAADRDWENGGKDAWLRDTLRPSK